MSLGPRPAWACTQLPSQDDSARANNEQSWLATAWEPHGPFPQRRKERSPEKPSLLFEKDQKKKEGGGKKRFIPNMENSATFRSDFLQTQNKGH